MAIAESLAALADLDVLGEDAHAVDKLRLRSLSGADPSERASTLLHDCAAPGGLDVAIELTDAPGRPVHAPQRPQLYLPLAAYALGNVYLGDAREQTSHL